MSKAFQNILVVVKQTPYETYRQMQKLGTAPIALRWERLKNRYEAHRRCVDTVTGILDRSNVSYSVTKREELHRGSVVGKDLVIAVGGDGTVLNTSSFIDDTIPVLGVNSDPTLAHEKGVHKLKDERRSTGALCAATANDVLNILPEILLGNIAPGLRARMQCLVRSAYTETRLPPALNDILVSNPIPAAISRFRLSLVNENVVPSYQSNANYQEIFSFHVWSSGLWVSTATGSTAAMHAAGGKIMDPQSTSLQYMIREHLVDEEKARHQKKAGHGFIRPHEGMVLRWNSQHGNIYVDGSHFRHALELGDEIKIDSKAPFLKMFDKIPTELTEPHFA